MIDFSQVGLKILKLRKENNLTQDDVASSLFVTRQLISKWELGQGIPSVDQIIELANLFNTSIDEILCLDENLTIDNENIFKGHNRYFIIKSILSGKIKVELSEVFYQFSKEERLFVLRQIIDGKYKTNLIKLKTVLSPGEIKFLEKEGL